MDAGYSLTRRQLVQGAGVAGLGLVAACGRLPWQAPPPPRIARIGWLGFDVPPSWREAFREGLHDLGYVEGQNIIIEFRDGDGRADRLPELAAELVHFSFR